uniref:Uncharacterized protein n=1 Tax=Oncorhynchus mykiss TaxID=8022 RepID=A0A8C7TSW9_ONCMY
MLGWCSSACKPPFFNNVPVMLCSDQDEGAIGLSTHLVNLSKLMESFPPRSVQYYLDFWPPTKDTVANILKGVSSDW